MATEAATDQDGLVIFDDEAVRERYLDHYETIRGTVRSEVVRRHLAVTVPHLSDSSVRLRVLDVGCGDARDSIWVASLGHDVIAFDSSAQMLVEAKKKAGDDDIATSNPIAFHFGTQADALKMFGTESFDLVLSHGVLMYHAEAKPFIDQHLALVRPDGYLSLLTKNAEALVMRAAHEGRFAEARDILDDSTSRGHLGVSTHAHTIQEISDLAFASGASVRSWAGVRIVSDTNPLDVEIANVDDVVELEWRLAMREPQRRVGALLHALILKGIDLSLLPS